MRAAVRETNLEGLEVRRGKVRDVYDLGDRILIVATDRISAYDVIMPTPIPDKGNILTALSLFWFDFLSDVTPNHLITADGGEMGPEAQAQADVLEGRSMLCHKADVFGVECVVGLPGGLRLAGVPGAGHDLRHRTAWGAEAVRPVARAHLHARHEGGVGPRREYLLRAGQADDRR